MTQVEACYVPTLGQYPHKSYFYKVGKRDFRIQESRKTIQRNILTDLIDSPLAIEQTDDTLRWIHETMISIGHSDEKCVEIVLWYASLWTQRKGKVPYGESIFFDFSIAHDPKDELYALLVVGMMVAVKFWQDWDFDMDSCARITRIPKTALAALEREFLMCIDYQLNISDSDIENFELNYRTPSSPVNSA